MNKLDAMLRSCLLWTLLMMGATFSLCRSVYASESPQSGNRYEIIRPIYLVAWYNSLNNKQISREAARAYLNAERYADRVWHAFRSNVSVGTIMTIIGPAPKIRHLLFFTSRTDQYFVRLDPDLSRGLDVILELNRGMEGSLDGLNPEIFRRVSDDDLKNKNPH